MVVRWSVRGCADERTWEYNTADGGISVSALRSHSFILFIHYLPSLRSLYFSLITHSHLRSHALLSRGHGWNCNAHRRKNEAEMILPFSKSTVESSPHNYSLQCTLWVMWLQHYSLCLSVLWVSPSTLCTCITLYTVTQLCRYNRIVEITCQVGGKSHRIQTKFSKASQDDSVCGQHAQIIYRHTTATLFWTLTPYQR